VTESSTATPADPNTGAGLIEFLDAAIEKGWFNVGSAKAMKVTIQKVFEVESGWASMDLRSLDADSLFERFRNLRRNDYSDDSMRIYKTRFRQALKMHLARIDGDSNWRSYGPSPKSTSNGRRTAQKAPVAEAPGPRRRNAKEVQDEDPPVAEASTPGAVPLIRFPFPLRDTVDVWLTLPRDLTTEEAERLSIFIRSLARTDGRTSAPEPVSG
jgi:hypothetical protein